MLLEVLERLAVVLDAELVRLLLALKSILELENSLLLEGVGDISWECDVGDDHRLDKDPFVRHDRAEVLDHRLGLLVSTDALDLARAHSADHVPHSLGDGGIEHLVKLAHIHAQVVDIV